MTSWWARWRLKLPASRLFTQPFIQAQIKKPIKAQHHWPLWGEFTGWPVNSPHEGPVTRKMFPFDDVIRLQTTVSNAFLKWNVLHLNLCQKNWCVIDNKTALVYVMALCPAGENPFPKSVTNVIFVDILGHNDFMMTSSNGNIFRVTGPLCREFTVNQIIPHKRPETPGFDVFFDLLLDKRLNKQSWGWWFETPSRLLWRHCNMTPSEQHFDIYLVKP